MFLPGSHAVKVNVGFYTQILGLGKARKDTLLEGLNCDNGDFDYAGGALSNFWRGAGARRDDSSGSMNWSCSTRL